MKFLNTKFSAACDISGQRYTKNCTKSAENEFFQEISYINSALSHFFNGNGCKYILIISYFLKKPSAWLIGRNRAQIYPVYNEDVQNLTSLKRKLVHLLVTELSLLSSSCESHFNVKKRFR